MRLSIRSTCGALLGAACLFLVACTGDTAPEPTYLRYPIVPRPLVLEAAPGAYALRPGAALRLPATEAAAARPAARYLSDWLLRTRGLELDTASGAGGITLLTDTAVASEEGYVLDVADAGVTLRARHGRGFFYGVQSLIQLIGVGGGPEASLPAVHIEDAPRFPYRGMMLDVSRHFFSLDFLKKYIDLLAQYKLNTFHWHLTDDQGWRIEIKAYPRLQEVAAYRRETLIGHYNDQPQRFDGTPYGGYYTQEEVRELVDYAAERMVTVIPEIELPGHASAAIAAYPELGCTGKPIEVATRWGIHEDIYCPNEATFAFLEGVLREVMELFPSRYIHIGGDEAPKTQWETSPRAQRVIRREGLADAHELQSWFIARVERFLNANGRQIIGWDEILEGGLAPNATVMSWRGEEGGIEAARQGHDVVMTPTSHLYFDYYQSDAPDEPLAIGGFLPIEKVYAYEPIPEELGPEEAKHVLGTQANLWTEYIDRPEKAEYMAFPRALALAEVAWSAPERRDFADFAGRLTRHIPRLKALGVDPANTLYDLRTRIGTAGAGVLQVELDNLVGLGNIRYTTDGSSPGPGSPLATGPIRIERSGTLRAQTYREGEPVGRPAHLTFNLHLAAGRPVVLASAPAPAYSAGGPEALVNGVLGSDERYGDSEWLGFAGEDLEATIDLGGPKPLRRLRFRFFQGPGQWIYPPRALRVSTSTDGETWALAGSRELGDAPAEDKIVEATLELQPVTGRYLRVEVENFGEIPAGLQGAGHRAWLFVDELVVE